MFDMLIMRVKLDNPKIFIDEILKEYGINLKQLSIKMGSNYSNLKQYRRGEMLFPEMIFISLLEYSKRKKYWENNVKLLNDNWGNIKGGFASTKDKNIDKRLEYARSFRKFTEIKIVPNEVFCEFYGMLLGDGCITSYATKGTRKIAIIICGNRKLDHLYLKSWKKILEEEYGLYSYYYEQKGKSVCTLTIRNKKLCTDLNEKYDVPIGLKYGKIKISDRILKLSWDKKKLVLRGLFDTDGIIFARKDEGYRLPHISITSKSNSFLKQIRDMLRKEGYPAYINGVDVRVRGIGNVKRWFSDIGSSNPRNLKKYEYFLKNGCVPNQSVIGPVG